MCILRGKQRLVTGAQYWCCCTQRIAYLCLARPLQLSMTRHSSCLGYSSSLKMEVKRMDVISECAGYVQTKQIKTLRKWVCRACGFTCAYAFASFPPISFVGLIFAQKFPRAADSAAIPDLGSRQTTSGTRFRHCWCSATVKIGEHFDNRKKTQHICICSHKVCDLRSKSSFVFWFPVVVKGGNSSPKVLFEWDRAVMRSYLDMRQFPQSMCDLSSFHSFLSKFRRHHNNSTCRLPVCHTPCILRIHVMFR